MKRWRAIACPASPGPWRMLSSPGFEDRATQETFLGPALNVVALAQRGGKFLAWLAISGTRLRSPIRMGRVGTRRAVVARWRLVDGLAGGLAWRVGGDGHTLLRALWDRKSVRMLSLRSKPMRPGRPTLHGNVVSVRPRQMHCVQAHRAAEDSSNKPDHDRSIRRRSRKTCAGWTVSSWRSST